MRLVEPYAGFAGVTLHALFGHASPSSRIGNKSKYAESILERLVLEGETIDRALLVDNDPAVVNFWACIRALPPVLGPMLIGEPRAVWERARKDRATMGVHGAASWLTWTCGARGGIGGFKGAHKRRPNVDGFIPSRDALLQRIVALAAVWDHVEVRHSAAEDIVFGPDDIVYLDPPYTNTQNYTGKTTATAILQTWVNAYAARRRAISSNVAGSYGIGCDAQWLPVVRQGQFRRSLTRGSTEVMLVA